MAMIPFAVQFRQPMIEYLNPRSVRHAVERSAATVSYTHLDVDKRQEYMLVEQDDCGGENPFDCLKRSYEYLTRCV